MDYDEKLRLVRRSYDAFNRGDLQELIRLLVKVGFDDQATRARPCALLVDAYAVARCVLWKRMRSI